MCFLLCCLICTISLDLPDQTVTSYHISEQILIYVIAVPPMGTLCDVPSDRQAGGYCDSEG